MLLRFMLMPLLVGLLFQSTLVADQNTSQLSQLGFGADTCTETLDKEGNLVAIARRHDGCALVDVSNPQFPVTLSTIQPDPGTHDIWDVDIHGNYLYLINQPDAVDSVLNNWVGLYIYDITNPYNPIPVGHILWGGAAWHHLAGSNHAGTVADINGVPHAFLCSNITGDVEVFDVSVPSAAVHLHSIRPTLNTYSSSFEVVVQNNKAFIAWGNGGFTVDDVTVPAAPVRLIQQAFTGQATISGGLKTISPTPDGLHIVTGEYTQWGNVRVWAADYNNGIVTQTANWQLNSGAALWTVRTTDDFAFVGHLEDGIQIIDIRNRNQVSTIGSFDPDAGSPQTIWAGVADVFVDGNTVYASHQTDGLYVVEFGDQVNITKADWQRRKKQLTVWANSSDSARTLTVVGYGQMTWNRKKGRYQLKLKPVASNPGTVIVESDLVGSASRVVRVR